MNAGLVIALLRSTSPVADDSRLTKAQRFLQFVLSSEICPPRRTPELQTPISEAASAVMKVWLAHGSLQIHSWLSLLSVPFQSSAPGYPKGPRNP